MNRAHSLVATAVIAACGAWPLATLAQSGGSGGASGSDGGSTRYDTPPGTVKPTDTSPAQPSSSGAMSGSGTRATDAGNAGSSAGATGSTSGSATTSTGQATGNSYDTTSSGNTAGSTGTTSSGATGSGTTGATRSDTTGSGTTGSGTTGSRAGGTTSGSPTGSSYNTLGMGSAAMTDADWERNRASSYSLLPMTSYGYFGVNLGRSNWGDGCDGFSGIFSCDDTALAGKIYTGGLISRMVGLEIGYITFGRPETSVGNWSAHGVNASIVANLPIDPVNLFARFGTTYGWTDTPTRPGFAGGDDSGFGIAYGAGIGFDVTPQVQITAEWDRNRFRFVSGDQDLDMYSIGLRYKF